MTFSLRRPPPRPSAGPVAVTGPARGPSSRSRRRAIYGTVRARRGHDRARQAGGCRGTRSGPPSARVARPPRPQPQELAGRTLVLTPVRRPAVGAASPRRPAPPADAGVLVGRVGLDEDAAQRRAAAGPADAAVDEPEPGEPRAERAEAEEAEEETEQPQEDAAAPQGQLSAAGAARGRSMGGRGVATHEPRACGSSNPRPEGSTSHRGRGRNLDPACVESVVNGEGRNGPGPRTDWMCGKRPGALAEGGRPEPPRSLWRAGSRLTARSLVL